MRTRNPTLGTCREGNEHISVVRRTQTGHERPIGGLDGLRQCGPSRFREATAEVRSVCDARGEANRARVCANRTEYEVSLPQRLTGVLPHARFPESEDTSDTDYGMDCRQVRNWALRLAIQGTASPNANECSAIPAPPGFTVGRATWDTRREARVCRPTSQHHTRPLDFNSARLLST
jgi:hypothetical protein